MIQVILDYNNIISNADAWIVSDNLSYLKVYSAFTGDHLPSEVTVLIKRSVYKVWFERLMGRLSENSYKIIYATLSGLLEAKWKCSLPKEINDEIIRVNRFLELDKTPVAGENFEDFILGTFFGEGFSKGTITIEDIPLLLNQSCSEEFKNSSKSIYLKAALTRRLEYWKSVSDKNLKFLLNKFIQSPEKLKAEITAFMVLRSYKNIASRLLPDFQIFDTLGLPLSKFYFDETSHLDIIQQIELEINSWETPTDDLSLIDFISKISGYLLLEFQKVEEILEKNKALLDQTIIDLLTNKFQNISAVKFEIELLKSKIPPTFPEKPDQNWSVQEMLDWAINWYFPYYKWSVSSPQDLKTLEPLALIFSDWYYTKYESIKYNSGKMLFNFVPNNFESFINEDLIDIVLIVDNLPWYFSEILAGAFANCEFYLESNSAYLAHIPTITEYSKKCLVSGMPNYIEVTDPSYKKILEEGGWFLFRDKLKLKYYPTIGAFYKEEILEGSTHFINYLQLDDLLHKSEEELGVSHLQAAKNAFETLIKKFVKHINNISNGKAVQIHVISDHGATFLEPNDRALLSAAFVKSKGLQNYSFRYACIPGNPHEFLSPDIVANAYVIGSDAFGLPENFLIARGFRSFLALKGRSMEHGGIQPEEVIIPHMVFEKVKAGQLSPTLVLITNKFRYASQEIMLEIGNPNNESISEVYTTLCNSNIEIENSTFLLPELPKKQKICFTFNGKFKQVGNKFEKENLKFRISYKIKSQKFESELNLPIMMISMVEVDDSDIFDNF